MHVKYCLEIISIKYLAIPWAVPTTTLGTPFSEQIYSLCDGNSFNFDLQNVNSYVFC